MVDRASRALVAGTRGSRLALIQTDWVLDLLRPAGLQFEKLPITTTGDRSRDALLGDGVFVKEIERSLLAGEIDLAVHSLKDVPTEPTEGITIAAIPAREDPREALVGGKLLDLEAGARIGTGSSRRSAQIKRLRDDVVVLPIRGNVPTRIEKAHSGEFDAVVLAMAGLRRLGLEPDQIFEADEFLPAPGQGALAVEVRSEDQSLIGLLKDIDDPSTRASVSAERAVLTQLGGGCLLPVATYGRVEGDVLRLDAVVVSPSGREYAHASSRGPIASWDEIAMEVAASLESGGARALLNEFDDGSR